MTVVALGLGSAATTGAAGAADPGEWASTSESTRAVIVRARAGRLGTVELLVRALGGRVSRELQIINGVAARVPAGAIPELSVDPAVASVTPDAPMQPMGKKPSTDASSTDASSTSTSSTDQASLGYDPSDAGSLGSIASIVGAPQRWAAGYTGAGIGVALIDTGVTAVPGLDTAGKVIEGPDLSFDSQSPELVHLDSFGHGTHLAGIIAGRDSTARASADGCSTCTGASGYTDQSKFVGIAPDAHIINVKVGATDGAADVSQVIAAIDWVVQHKDDAGLNIRVLNLSFGTNTSQRYEVDPLAYAAEVAWNAGIVVVAAGGNDGLNVPTLADPAYSPRLIAVGADDPMGTMARTDDTIPDFATHGTWERGVDLVAPGVHVLSLRVPGSYVDTYYSEGIVGTRFQPGSGTSQSTAVVSGVVALLRQQFPQANPDQIKALLRLGAFRINANILFSGAGIVDANGGAFLGANSSVYDQLPTTSAATPSTGAGTLEGSRGDAHVIDGTVELRGEQDIFGNGFDPTAMAALEAKARSWKGGSWNGSVWTGTGSASSGWSAVTWTGANWAGSPWSGSRWRNMAWDGSRWRGSGWSGSRWRSSSWTDALWSGSRWR